MCLLPLLAVFAGVRWMSSGLFRSTRNGFPTVSSCSAQLGQDGCCSHRMRTSWPKGPPSAPKASISPALSSHARPEFRLVPASGTWRSSARFSRQRKRPIESSIFHFDAVRSLPQDSPPNPLQVQRGIRRAGAGGVDALVGIQSTPTPECGMAVSEGEDAGLAMPHSGGILPVGCVVSVVYGEVTIVHRLHALIHEGHRFRGGRRYYLCHLLVLGISWAKHPSGVLNTILCVVRSAGSSHAPLEGVVAHDPDVRCGRGSFDRRRAHVHAHIRVIREQEA